MDLDELDDGQSAKDFRRANGAPMVKAPDGSGRWLRRSRPSGFGHDLDDETALNIWKQHRAIEGVAITPSLAASIAANMGRKEGSAERLEKAIQIGRGEEAADLGTALHAMAHRLETEPGFRAPEPYASDLACYLNTIDQAGLESTHFECQISSDRWKAAGTADRIYRAIRRICFPDGTFLEPGQSVIGDLKTGKKLDYSLPGYTIQEAIYADGVFYDVDTDVRTPLPDGMHTGWGLIVHLPAGKAECTLWWADLQVGRVGAELVQQVRAWRKRDDFVGRFVFPTSDEVAVLAQGVYELEHPILDETESDGSEFEGEWLAGMLPWAQARINQIGMLPEPRALLVRRWPENVPPLRTGDVSAMQLSRVLDLLDQVEAAFSIPYCEGDPRVAWGEGRHKSVGVRGNTPIQLDRLGADYE